MSTKVPEIARKISPKECRELLEFLLQGPLKDWEASVGREVVDNPTPEQRKQKHVPLSGRSIMLPHSRAQLHFETDWHPLGRLSAADKTRAVYLGAVSESTILDGGSPVDCQQRWDEILQGAGTPATSPSTTSATSPSTGWGESVRNAGISAVAREAVTVFRENSDGARQYAVALWEKFAETLKDLNG